MLFSDENALQRSSNLFSWSRTSCSTVISLAGSMDMANKLADFPSFLAVITDKFKYRSINIEMEREGALSWRREK